MRPRISIAMLLAAMVPIALGLTALSNPTAFWEGTVLVLAIVSLFSAIVGVCYRREADRAFWFGFSLFGWGFFLLFSGLDLSIRPGASVQFSFGSTDEHDRLPVAAFVRDFVDTLQLNRSTIPKSIGEKVQVQWGSAGSYYPATVSGIKDGQFKIRYNSDPQGSFDEWVGVNRIKSDGLARSYRIAEMLFLLLFALAGGMIGLYFFATGRSRESRAESSTSAQSDR